MSVNIAGSNIPGELKVSADGFASVDTRDKIDVDSAENSTTAPLAANLQFTGAWKDVTAYKSVSIYQLSNTTSATGGLKLQFSNDGSTIDFSFDISTSFGVNKFYKLPIYGKFFRVIYVNGGTAQASFRINTRFSFAVADLTTQVADFTVTATAAVSTAVNANLPAAGIGTYHYITSIIIQKFATAALTAGAAPIICTQNNLKGFSPNTDARALVQGELINCYQQDFTIPLKSQSSNTTTLIAVPAVTGAIYKVIVTYFIGA